MMGISGSGMVGSSAECEPALDLHAIAGEMMAAQDAARQLPPFSARYANLDLPAAYGVAELMHQVRLREGAHPIGRKLGFTNPQLWPAYGVRQPIWAHLYEHTLQPDAGTHRYKIGHLLEPKIEPEIVVHFRSAPPPDGELHAILDCIDWIAHAFEIVQSHFPGWKIQAADTVVGGGMHGALLLGERQPIEQLGAHLRPILEQLEVRLYCDEALREVGRGKNVLGSPLLAIAHLLRVLAECPPAAALTAGELVTTGTMTAAYAIEPAQTWRSEIRGIGLRGLTARFER